MTCRPRFVQYRRMPLRSAEPIWTIRCCAHHCRARPVALCRRPLPLCLNRFMRIKCNVHCEGTSLGILFIDLDGLKQINDTHGHEAGDAALVAIARALETTTRKS